jgi:hypothetical protein
MDLNPIRDGVSKSIEANTFTCWKLRFEAAKESTNDQTPAQIDS